MNKPNKGVQIEVQSAPPNKPIELAEGLISFMLEFSFMAPVLALGGAWVWKTYFEDKTAILKKKLSVSLETDRDIISQLNQMIGIGSASRAILLQPHNGDKFTTGNSHFKLTCTHEAMEQGFEGMQGSIQGTSIGLFSDILTSQLLPRYYAKQELDAMRNWLGNLLRGHNAEAMTVIPIAQDEGILGIVLLMYVGSGTQTERFDSVTYKLLHEMDDLLAILTRPKRKLF